MCITVVLTALSGVMASSALATEPAWVTEYAKARQLGQKVERPLAVFIGSGQAGWEQVSREGKLAREVKQLLARNYVCVYVNRDQEAGNKLAAAFEVPDGPGLIISSRSGSLQAFRHEGNLANQALEEHLQRFADPQRVTTQTETTAPRRVSYYPQAPAVNYAPMQFQPMMGAPMSSFGSAGRSC